MADVKNVAECMAVLSGKDDSKVLDTLTKMQEMLREDSSSFSLFEETLKGKNEVFGNFMHFLENKHDAAVADKAAWTLSAMLGHLPKYFTESNASHLLTAVQVSDCSEMGILEAVVNILKADVFRACVWSPNKPTVKELILNPQDQSPQVMYKSLFAIWILSGDADIVMEFKALHVVKKLRDIMASCRVEKVVRISLMVLKNCLAHKALCEDMVESNVLDAVQALEFEKWRDSELYDEIREMSTQVGNEVAELGNFERYQREVNSGKLQWGYIHSSKFWGENVMKFDKNDFSAVKALSVVLSSPSSDLETLAVACHDVGQFVTLHPLGKKKVAEFGMKERIMVLMAAGGDDKREVRREALLCCQKLMLNKWQEAATK